MEKTYYIILSTVFFLFFFFVYSIFSPLDISKPEIVVIPDSATGNEVIKILKFHRLLKDNFWPRVYMKMKGWGPELQAGEYEFSPSISVAQILKKIHLGQVRGYTLTIPEGWTVKDIAEFLAEHGLVEKERFLSLAHEEEGYLYPDTYNFYKGIGEKKIIELMKKRFYDVVKPLFRAKDRGNFLDLKSAVILASVVEKEAMLDDEREIIASVFLNRLKRHIKLESCATVIYALGRHKNNLTYSDLKINSLYNTYIHYGLPPTPISNPGEASIKAVSNPVKTDFLYFVSRQDGTHEFSKTLREHNLAKEKYKKMSD